jgi:hypothetical protein
MDRQAEEARVPLLYLGRRQRSEAPPEPQQTQKRVGLPDTRMARVPFGWIQVNSVALTQERHRGSAEGDQPVSAADVERWKSRTLTNACSWELASTPDGLWHLSSESGSLADGFDHFDAELLR